MRSTDIISVSALVLASAVALGCNRDASAPGGEKGGEAAGDVTEKSRDFIVAAAVDGMLEVEAGKLAESRAQSEPVKQFARMMIEHHAKANEELAKLAQSKRVEIPKALDEDAQDELEDLREESGEDFDEEYIDLMIAEHRRAIRKFERQANRDDDPEVRGWASQTLPTLRTHLDEAKRTEDALDEGEGGVLGQDRTNTQQPEAAGAGAAAGADAAAGAGSAAGSNADIGSAAGAGSAAAGGTPAARGPVSQTPGTATKAEAGLDPTPDPRPRPEEGRDARASVPGDR